VFQVVDLSRLEVEIHLAERYLARIAVGQKARVTSEFSELVANGEVIRIAPTVDAATGTVKVTVAVQQDGVVLRPGMFVNVDVVTETREQALLVPKRALVYEDGEPVVYVARDGLATRVPLGPGQEQGDEREVAEGIEEGELVIVMGQTALKDGAAVSIASANGSEESQDETADPTEDGQDKNVEAE
jgi:membrane fusion protein, multidrug efflux system